MKRSIWRRMDGTSIEFCTFSFEHCTKISGQVIGNLGGMLGKVDYEVECASDGTTKSVSVQMNSLHDDFLA
ncbi:MAG: putative glycolipid-binding domain-containing protein [Alicyclobacillus sp.]|nr:putative glycolipid-binding domain-containing protein [Alicyclobacillus sp.]